MKPFLRWAGGKNWLIKHIDQVINPDYFNNYHEPFLGGGSIFFHLNMPNECFLSDLNESLINTYVQVQNNVDQIIDFLSEFKNESEFYYQIRNQVYIDDVQRAAQFIYLNQTSFNGIYRVNLKGVYNVPFGHRTKDFIQESLLKEASNYLKGAHFYSGQFDESLNRIQPGDLVFLDPPYTITHNNNGFIKYNERLFSEKDQYRLAQFIEAIIELGAFYVLTNAAHTDIYDIFHYNRPLRLSRASLIGGKSAKRGEYEEFLFTNIRNEFIEANRS